MQVAYGSVPTSFVYCSDGKDSRQPLLLGSGEVATLPFLLAVGSRGGSQCAELLPVLWFEWM